MRFKTNHYLLESTEISTGDSLDSILLRIDKKFTCSICNKSYSSKHCLKEHGYTHSDVRPYKCAKCPKMFKHASQLSVHKKTHFNFSALVWPKLTSMLSNNHKKEDCDQSEFEKIELPMISSPQIWCVPSYNFS